MLSITRRFLVLFCAALVILLPLGVSSLAAAEDSADELAAEKMAVDVVAIRPLGIISIIAGCAVYLVSLPFSIPGGNADAVWKTTVETPARFTFDRPIGDF